MSNAEHDRRIDYIEFSVPSIPKVKRFYGQAFGWSFEGFSFPGGRRFHFTDPGGTELAVWSDK